MFKNILFSILALYLTGCSIYNPFIPPSGGTIEVDEGCALPPQEPINSKAMYRSTMKSYQVNGVRYQPQVPQIGQKFRGVASWYGPNFHGGKTANGEYYDMTTFTAAHKTLPINTEVKVTNLDNGEFTIVRINDRGPFVNDRIIDLSQAAAEQIGMIKKGTANVELEVISIDPIVEQYRTYKPFPKATNSIENVAPSNDSQTITPLSKSKVTTITNTPSSPKISQKLTHKGFKIQILSSTNNQKAKAYAQKYGTIDDNYHTSIKQKDVMGQKLYRVYIGDFESVDRAREFIKSKNLKGAFVTKG